MADRRGKKHRRLYKARQRARGAKIVRHKLIGGRTGGKASAQRKSGNRGKGGGGKLRNVVIKIMTKYPDFSIYAIKKLK